EGWLKPYVMQHQETNSHVLQPEIYKEGLYHDCDDDITELAKVLLSNEPVESGMNPLELTEENYGRVPRVYIECTKDRAVTPFIQQKMYTEMPCGKVYSLATSHSPFFSKPKELVEILLDL
ncbi:MAG TPA: hypothetical protein VFQ58_10095, partial [Flavisolibacter sp.]|nr:hypothetical protein [Flavisolibacter sp.]